MTAPNKPTNDSASTSIEDKIDKMLMWNINGHTEPVVFQPEMKKAILALVQADRQELIARHDNIFAWLLGESGDFPVSEPGRRYGWRTELRRRLTQLKGEKQ